MLHGTSFIDLVSLATEPGSDDLIGAVAPERSGRLFGGQLLAQGLAAAYRRVDDDRFANSIHAHFLRAGTVDDPIHYRVGVVRDGRSFSTRTVDAHQNGRHLFTMVASFHIPEDGMEYHSPAPARPVAPAGADRSGCDYSQFVARDLTSLAEWDGQARPVSIHYLNPPADDDEPVYETQLMEMRIEGDLPNDRWVHDCGLAYMSDTTLADNVLLPHGRRWHDDRLDGASLDHAMWFHRSTRVDQWVLFEQWTEATAGARGLAGGRFHDDDGARIATCSQEGLIRWHPNRAP